MKKHKKALRVAPHPGISLWTKCLWLLFAIAFAGLVLESQLGERFIFRYSKAYYDLMPWLYVCLLPLSAIVWYRYDEYNQTAQYRRSWWRWLVFFPLAIGLSTSLLICTPFGWSALAGRLAGGDPAVMEVKLIQVEHARHRIGKCDQKMVIEVDGRHISICAEDLTSSAAPAAGQWLLLKGKNSAFGFVIEEITSR